MISEELIENLAAATNQSHGSVLAEKELKPVINKLSLSKHSESVTFVERDEALW